DRRSPVAVAGLGATAAALRLAADEVRDGLRRRRAELRVPRHAVGLGDGDRRERVGVDVLAADVEAAVGPLPRVQRREPAADDVLPLALAPRVARAEEGEQRRRGRRGRVLLVDRLAAAFALAALHEPRRGPRAVGLRVPREPRERHVDGALGLAVAAARGDEAVLAVDAAGEHGADRAAAVAERAVRGDVLVEEAGRDVLALRRLRHGLL